MKPHSSLVELFPVRGKFQIPSFFLRSIKKKTDPLYLNDPYLKTCSASILDVLFEKEGVYRLILDKTIFYPMGGGQPTDQGEFILENGAKLEVYQVLLKEGEINHYVKTSETPSAGQKVDGTINWDRRFKNMQIHSAAHVIDFALFLLGLTPHILTPLKGDHGKKPFIHYSGMVGTIKNQLQAKVDEIIAKDLKFSWSFELMDLLEKEAIYLQPGLPKNKPLRALRLENVGTVADGGTIVSKTSEVGKVSVLSVESKDNETIVRYEISI